MSLLALADVKPHLKITQTTDDTVLQAKLDAAEAYVSRETNGAGALTVTEVTERIDGGSTALVLRRRPVVSVTSVTGAGGNALVVADLDLDLERGRIGYDPVAPVIFPLPWYTVVYTSGYATDADLPPDLTEAVRLMTQHFYATQRGQGRRGTGGDQGPLEAFSRAREILDGFQLDGMA